jgi:RsiW-degrading membrane proteinase PrsW (M82 family)
MLSTIALLFAGLLPALIIAYFCRYFLFKRNRLPAHKAVLAFLAGIIWGVPAFYYEKSMEEAELFDLSVWWQALIAAFVIVAIIEELGKAGALILNARIKAVNEPLDIIVMSILISMGFAAIENILYSQKLGWEVALFRSFTAVPAHAFFACLLAYFPAMEYLNAKKSIPPYVHGFIVACILHGLYDFFIIQEFSEPFTLGSLVVLLIAGILSWLVIRRINKKVADSLL